MDLILKLIKYSHTSQDFI